MKTIFLILNLGLAGCLTLSEEEICNCPKDSKIEEEVCGEDGITYANDCLAECAGVDVAHVGQCEEDEDCDCPKNNDEVCGTDGNTYDNECLAECAGVAVEYEGPCEGTEWFMDY